MSDAKIVKGETETGFAFEICAEVLDDYELLEDLNDLSKNTGVLPRVLKTVLGEEQTVRLKEHCRNAETGRVPVTAINEELERIFNAINALKK